MIKFDIDPASIVWWVLPKGLSSGDDREQLDIVIVHERLIQWQGPVSSDRNPRVGQQLQAPDCRLDRGALLQLNRLDLFPRREQADPHSNAHLMVQQSVH